jgi:hypothetical protein
MVLPDLSASDESHSCHIPSLLSEDPFCRIGCDSGACHQLARK